MRSFHLLSLLALLALSGAPSAARAAAPPPTAPPPPSTHKAPEPLTMAGLAVGAGALAWARRRSQHQRS